MPGNRPVLQRSLPTDVGSDGPACTFRLVYRGDRCNPVLASYVVPCVAHGNGVHSLDRVVRAGDSHGSGLVWYSRDGDAEVAIGVGAADLLFLGFGEDSSF